MLVRIVPFCAYPAKSPIIRVQVVAGAVVGSIAVLLCVIMVPLLACYSLRYRRRAKQPSIAGIPATDTQKAATDNEHAAGILLKGNECYSTTHAIAMESNECYAANIPLEANKCYRTAATDNGIAPADDDSETESLYEYIK